LQEIEIDTVRWNEYYMYMAWQNRQDEAWQTLKDYVSENPSKSNILYSRNLSEKYGYPSLKTQKDWLAMQYAVSDSLPILKEYYSTFNTPENAEEITKVLQKIDQLEPNYKNYQNYLNHLLLYDQEKAALELTDLEPEETSSLWDIADEITWYYANKKDFRNAYKWAVFADAIPFTNKMYWLSELEEFKKLESEYATYISTHKDDDEAKSLMSKLMLYNKKTNRSWEVASTIQKDVVRDSVKELLNAEVIYAERVTQKELLDKYTDLFKKETQEQILTAIRKEEHNFAEVKLAVLGDNNRQTSFEKKATYTIRGKNKTKHAITASHTDLYEIKNVSMDDEDNIDKVVYGADYTFRKQSEKGGKEFSVNIGVEVDEKQNGYFNAKTSFAISKEKQFTSTEASVAPAQTSAAYEKNIYRAQLSSYHFNRVADWLKSTLYVEGRYYTDENYEASATARLDLESASKKYFKVIPLVEASISRSSIDQVSDYPYYMVDKRFYTGGGAELKLGSEQSKFNISVEATTFIDNDLGNFNRYRANSSLKIGDYTVLKAAAELSTQPGAYSNFLSVGMSYIF
jgi:hypothetical protein